MRDGDDHRTWNIFHRRQAHGLCCAVSAEAPLPRFLFGREWAYGCQLARGDSPMAGFSPAAAEIGERLNGFYLFIAFPFPRRAPEPEIPVILGEPNGRLAHWTGLAIGSA